MGPQIAGMKAETSKSTRVFIKLHHPRIEDEAAGAAWPPTGRQREARDGRAWVRLGQTSGRSRGFDKAFWPPDSEWRRVLQEPGCSMSIIIMGTNDDRLSPASGAPPLSKSEGRQGAGGHVHLVSPEMAAAAAIAGRFADARGTAMMPSQSHRLVVPLIAPTSIPTPSSEVP